MRSKEEKSENPRTRRSTTENGRDGREETKSEKPKTQTGSFSAYNPSHREETSPCHAVSHPFGPRCSGYRERRSRNRTKAASVWEWYVHEHGSSACKASDHLTSGLSHCPSDQDGPLLGRPVPSALGCSQEGDVTERFEVGFGTCLPSRGPWRPTPEPWNIWRCGSSQMATSQVCWFSELSLTY